MLAETHYAGTDQELPEEREQVNDMKGGIDSKKQ